jgi:hypothetical protein
MHLHTDAAGSLGFGAIMNTKWFNGEWPVAMKEYNITVKELFQITLAVEIWGSSFKNRCALFHSDNQAVVHIINKQTSKDTLILKLVRRLVVASMKFNNLMKAEHIPGHFNILADLLSRFQIQQFRARAPYMNREPTLVNLAIAPNTKNVYCNALKNNTSFLINHFSGKNMASLEKDIIYIYFLIP